MKIELNLAKIPFNLDHTLSCGQTFRWEKRGDWWVGVVCKAVIKIRQKNGLLESKSSSSKVNSGFLSRYFRLDDDLSSIYSHITKDNCVRKAVDQFHGLRLVRQDPWECLISYTCATFKNIPAIKRMIFGLCMHFGRSFEFEDECFYAFPDPQALAEASLQELRECKLGFRARRVRETARLVSKGGFDLNSLRNLSYAKAKEKLLTLPGVGQKVADCVLLFSLDKLEAFPIDVWMKRTFLEKYQQYFEAEFVAKLKASRSISPGEYRIISKFGREYFGEYLGYAQEYLYHYRRCLEATSFSVRDRIIFSRKRRNMS